MTPAVDLGPVMPELILVGAAIVALLVGAIARRVEPLVLLFIALAGVAGAATASVLLWDWGGGLTVLAGAVATDRFAVVARLILLGVAALGLVLGHHYFQRSGERRTEFSALVLFATSGMTLIAASADLITMFLALEILSLSLYVLTGSSTRIGSVEGAMKYFLLGAFSSAFFLYGVAMAYGATGSTALAAVATALGGRTGSMALAVAAMVLLAVGFGFKVSAVPFHMWTPDVYQGAPTAVTAFMSAGTKVAAFAAFMRVFNVAFQPLIWDWTPVIWGLAAASMVVGSVLAIAQTDIKRMLAYSSIAHAGFVLTGMTAAGRTGMSAALFYLLAYALMIVGAFGVVMVVSSRGEAATSLESYRGLYRQSPLLAGLLSVFLLSMAGIPPTAGFFAKVSVFGAAIGAGHWELALIGVLASVVAAFFYIRVMVLMYMQEPSGDHEPDASLAPRVAIAIPAIGTLVLGILPGLVTDLLGKASVIRW
ncbi:MAG TPA: NADH-quinone oxidoreductase subunit NuoN [Actinomycetota bacterium]|nr:NADH-quinone oxidoreductase subunit NuoN [Actinomycetota bacterium]